MQLINQLRNNRIKDHTPLTAANNDDALRQVLEERRRELAMSGMTRYIDLKRLNRDARFAKTVTHATAEGTFTLPANDAKYVLPIPPKVLRFNSGTMQPNER